MPYKNIVFIKLEKRLLNDHRWFGLSEQAQLNYIKLILIAAETYNKIPANIELLCTYFRTNQRKTTILKTIKEIELAFPKFKKNEEYYYFEDFDEKTNYIRALPSDAEGFPKVVVDKEEEKEKDKEEEKEEIDTEAILSHWNNFAEELGLSKIKEITKKRLAHVKSRLKEPNFDFIKIIEQIKGSDFLKGNNNRGWKVDFDFIFSSTDNYLKILEGKYNGQNNSEKRRSDYVSEQERESELKQAYGLKKRTDP